MKSEFNPQLTALKLALKKMFQGNHFSICTIDSCLKLTGAIPNKEVYKIMSTIHCVDFKEMEPDFRQWIFEQSILMFQANGFDFNKFEILDNKISTLYLS
jgi:hypothetical protein